jgi:hypothetical protein
MRFHNTDNHVFSAAPASECFAQHAIGFADPRSVAEKQLKYAARFLWRRRDFQPVFGLLGQGASFSVSDAVHTLE